MKNKYDDYITTNDNELLYLVGEENEDAKDILYEKYHYIIALIVKKYVPFCHKLGLEYKDFYQEALLAFADALAKYDEDKNSSLPTFIKRCVERRIRDVLKKGMTQKSKIIKDSLSIDYIYENKSKITWQELIGDDNRNNPLNSIATQERIDNVIKQCLSLLSDSEKDVFELLIYGYAKPEIASILKINISGVNNTLQRIKRKCKDVLENGLEME